MERSKDTLRAQMTRKQTEKTHKSPVEKAFAGNTEMMLSTGSTLLDLAISGGRKRGGGVPGGVILEAFGPEGSGKTVLLCELGGAAQRAGGAVLFNDPEARLNKVFASMFDLDIDTLTIEKPNTVTEMFQGVQKWKPEGRGEINVALTDSLAALSTNMEMDNDDGDKMGMRRAKEFSEGLRKLARVIEQKNYILACSNQIRVNADATAYGEKFTVPGGKAFAFYASVRLRFHKPEKIERKRTFKGSGKEIKKVVGGKTKVEVYKNSCDAPYRSADVYILYDYGIDDIRANLQYVKDNNRQSTYCVCDTKLDVSLEKSIKMVEEQGLVDVLKEEVIDLWHAIENTFKEPRQKKKR